MKRKITLFASLLIFCSFSYGQVVSKDAFEKSVDYLNCKVVERSLKDNNPNAEYEVFKGRFPCDTNFASANKNIPSKGISEFLKVQGKYQKTVALSEEIDSIKSKFRQDWKSEDVMEYLSNEVFTSNDTYKKIAEFAESRKGSDNFENFKKEIKTNLATYLLADNKSTESSKVGRNNSQPQQVNEESFTNYILSWLPTAAFLLLTLALLAIAYKFYRNLRDLESYVRSLDTRLDSTERKSNAKPSQPLAKTSSSTLAPADILHFRNEIDELKIKIDSLMKESTKTRDPIFFSNPEPVQYNKAEPIQELFYLSTPNEDGSFNEKSAHSSFREGASIYKFTKINSSQAEFQIDDREESIKLALEYPDKNIDPACDAQNAFSPKASRIVTMPGGAGKAELIGDKWKITQKAIVRYEY